MNVPTATVRRWQEESNGIFRNIRGQFVSKKKKEGKPVEKSTLNIWIGIALLGWAAAVTLIIVVEKIIGLCVAS